MDKIYSHKITKGFWRDMGIYSLNICGPVVLPEATEAVLLLSHLGSFQNADAH